MTAELGSVTAAAAQLYLTQPAVSAALRRLTTAIGPPVFARQGRGLALTSRGEQLLRDIAPHLGALVDAALSAPAFDPRTSERAIRLGLSDAAEQWLLPALLRALDREAPRMRLVTLPVQFRTVGEALASRRIDAAVTVADDLPGAIRRRALFSGGFVCLFDPRHARLGAGRLTERRYFEHEHVVVSYNGDLRGIVEDATERRRQVRCSVSSFANIGALVEGSARLATIPALVATQVRATRPRLRTAPLPFSLPGAPMELLWPITGDDDDAARFVRERIVQVAAKVPKGAG